MPFYATDVRYLRPSAGPLKNKSCVRLYDLSTRSYFPGSSNVEILSPCNLCRAPFRVFTRISFTRTHLRRFCSFFELRYFLLLLLLFNYLFVFFLLAPKTAQKRSR